MYLYPASNKIWKQKKICLTSYGRFNDTGDIYLTVFAIAVQ